MKTPDAIKQVARELRKNMTPAEKVLWEKLRAKRFFWMKFQRQFPLYVFTENSWFDRYIIPDFICFEKKFILELDGNIHDLEEVYTLDRTKEKIVENMWFTILRIKNKEIFKNLDIVLEKIKIEIT